MKYISLITGSDLHFVMGVNYYLESFLQCNDLFKEVKVNRVYSGKQILKVDDGETMPIGSDIGTKAYKCRTTIRSLMRKLFTDRFYPFRLFRYTLNSRIVSRGSVERFFSDEAPCDYIIFQEMGCAEYYFRHLHNHPDYKGIKTMLIIHTEDDSGSMLLNTFSGYGKKDMRHRLYRQRDYVYGLIDKVIYISKKAYKNSILLEEKKAFVYNGSPDIEYTFSERMNDKCQFVCVGSMDGRKGQDIIIEALHLMDSVHRQRLHLTFVGGGNMMEVHKAKVEAYNLNDSITFTGRRNDVPDILRSMDCFIMPSKVEGLPMSAIEALRAGLFLILTDTGGNAELCADGCGLVCSRQPEDILAKMCSVMDDQMISTKQKLRSRKRFLSQFSLIRMAEGYECVLNSL